MNKIITIGREFGSGGRELGRRLAEELGFQYYDREIPVPALKALREGVVDGSIRPDVNIYAVYQCLLNAYTGTTIYENVSFGVSPVDIVQFTGELLVNYIKNEPEALALCNKN